MCSVYICLTSYNYMECDVLYNIDLSDPYNYMEFDVLYSIDLSDPYNYMECDVLFSRFV